MAYDCITDRDMLQTKTMRRKLSQHNILRCAVQDGGWFDGVVTDYNAADKNHW